MIQIDNANFSYGRGATVLKDFSLSIDEGGVYGLLGRNGTGKSTLLYLMTGLLRPQKGTVTYNGVPTSQRKVDVLRDFFLVPEEYNLPDMRLKQYVNTLRPFYPQFSDELLTRCLDNFEMASDINLRSLSMGQKKKVYISMAMAANTRVLLLDEPTNGLDILAKAQFRKAMTSVMEPEKTVIVSTHQVHDVENLLDHIIIIETNRVLLNMAIDEDNRPESLEQLFVETVKAN